jgi:hypothetical protein
MIFRKYASASELPKRGNSLALQAQARDLTSKNSTGPPSLSQIFEIFLQIHVTATALMRNPDVPDYPEICGVYKRVSEHEKR